MDLCRILLIIHTEEIEILYALNTIKLKMLLKNTSSYKQFAKINSINVISLDNYIQNNIVNCFLIKIYVKYFLKIILQLN